MLDLRDDGTIAIDFDGEHPRQVIFPRPIKMVVEEADIKRWEILASAGKLAEEVQARAKAIAESTDEDGPSLPSAQELARESRKHGADQAAEWWELVAHLLNVELPPQGEWPSYMTYGRGVIDSVIEFWNTVPLARGGKLVQTTS